MTQQQYRVSLQFNSPTIRGERTMIEQLDLERMAIIHGWQVSALDGYDLKKDEGRE